MLTIFNRTVVFMTYNEENMRKACFSLEHCKIDYILKTTKIADVYAKDEGLQIAYKVYVRKDKANEAQACIHKALFDED